MVVNEEAIFDYLHPINFKKYFVSFWLNAERSASVVPPPVEGDEFPVDATMAWFKTLAN